MKKSNAKQKNTDKQIDHRIVDILRENVKDIEVEIQQEVNRKITIKEMARHYEMAKKLFFKKLRFNKINMILQMFLLLIVLIVLLFGS